MRLQEVYFCSCDSIEKVMWEQELITEKALIANFVLLFN